MVAILQLLVSMLILLSFALVVSVPVILVSPGEWEKSKGLVYTGAGLWFGSSNHDSSFQLFCYLKKLSDIKLFNFISLNFFR